MKVQDLTQLLILAGLIWYHKQSRLVVNLLRKGAQKVCPQKQPGNTMIPEQDHV